MNDTYGFPNVATPSTPDDASNMMAFCTTTGSQSWSTAQNMAPSITMTTSSSLNSLNSLPTPKTSTLDTCASNAYYASPLQWQAASSLHQSTIYHTGYPLNNTTPSFNLSATTTAAAAPAFTHYAPFTDPVAQNSYSSPVATPKINTQDILQHDQQQQQFAATQQQTAVSSSDPSLWPSITYNIGASSSQPHFATDEFSRLMKSNDDEFSPTLVSASAVFADGFPHAHDHRFIHAVAPCQYIEDPGFTSTADNSVVSEEEHQHQQQQQQRHPEEEEDIDGDDDEQQGGGEILYCRWADCTMQTRRLQQLITHVSDVHVGRGKQAYYCEWANCPRKNMPFSKRHKIHNHMRTHTGERPFACNQEGCNKRFSRLDSLNTHIKTHSSIRPYTCSVPGCTKAYFHSRSLRKHTKVHLLRDSMMSSKRKRVGRKKKHETSHQQS